MLIMCPFFALVRVIPPPVLSRQWSTDRHLLLANPPTTNKIKAKTSVKPGSNQVRSSVEPVPSMANQDPTRVKPGPKPMSNQNKIKAKPLSNNCKPESNHDQAMASQGRSKVEAVSSQTRSSRCQTRVKPGPNKNQTSVKPGSDMVKARVKPWSNQSQITEPGGGPVTT